MSHCRPGCLPPRKTSPDRERGGSARDQCAAIDDDCLENRLGSVHATRRLLAEREQEAQGGGRVNFFDLEEIALSRVLIRSTLLAYIAAA